MAPQYWKKSLKMATSGEMEDLRKRLEKYLPYSNLIHGALIANAAYKGLLDVAGIKVFYSDHSSLTVATPVFTYRGIQSLAFFWDEEEEDDRDVAALFATIPSIDWNESIYIYASPVALTRKLEKWIDEGTLGGGFLKSVVIAHAYYYSLTSPSMDISLPEGYEIRDLQKEHAAIMKSNWKFNRRETNEGYERMVATAPGVGVFLKNSNSTTEEMSEKNSPVAWTQLSFFNFLINTFTLPTHRGLGLAKAVTAALAKRALQDTGIASTYIAVNNPVSLAIHEKLGFTRHHKVRFHYYKSTLHPSEPYIENI